MEKVASHYSMDADTTKRFILNMDGQDKGYFQYYRFDGGQFGGKSIGVDQFLAQEADLRTGLGSQSLTAFIELIKKAEAPNVILVDPHPDNKRAIGCYKKCGFRHAPEHSRPQVFMMMKRL